MGERCGVYGCEERPTGQCANCEIWYCFDHFIIHFDVLSEKEQEYQKQTNQVWDIFCKLLGLRNSVAVSIVSL